MESALIPMAIGIIKQLWAFSGEMGLTPTIVNGQTRTILKNLNETNLSIDQLKQDVIAESRKTKETVTTGVVLGVHSHLPEIKNIPSDKVEILIRILFRLKERARNVGFTVFVIYPHCKGVGTQSCTGTSSERIEDLVMKFDSFLGAISRVPSQKTVYVSSKIRGKYDLDIESFCIAALTTITTHVCNFPQNIKLEDLTTCKITPRDEKETIAMLDTSEIGEEYDRLRRLFLVGDTKSGKSTLGNALTENETFTTCKGMTGTMKIERSGNLEDIENERWLIEFYDTPGLNDKDCLEQAVIVDQISILQKVSSIIMTIAVDAGIIGSMRKSLESYKSCFGSSIASMMIVVLKTNEPADEESLRDFLEFNLPSISKLVESIPKENIYYVSLTDLRKRKESASHYVVKRIRSHCRFMPLRLIETLKSKYQRIRKSLLEKSGDLKKKVKQMIDDGWMAYDNLTNIYEQSPYIKMTNEGMIDGFVLKNSDSKKVALSVATLGLCNLVRKTAIHISPRGHSEKKAWQSFYEENESNCQDSSMMGKFGEMLDGKDMAVIVEELPVSYAGTFRVNRYEVEIFHPIRHTSEELADFAKGLIDGEGQEIAQEVIDELLKAAVPANIKHRERRLPKNE